MQWFRVQLWDELMNTYEPLECTQVTSTTSSIVPRNILADPPVP